MKMTVCHTLHLGYFMFITFHVLLLAHFTVINLLKTQICLHSYYIMTFQFSQNKLILKEKFALQNSSDVSTTVFNV